MPLATCQQCQHMFYFHKNMRSERLGYAKSNLCAPCAFPDTTKNQVYHFDPTPFRVGERAAIKYDLNDHYEMVIVQEITPEGRVIADGHCYSSYGRSPTGMGVLVPWTPEIEEYHLRHTLYRNCVDKFSTLRDKSSFDSKRLAQVLDLLLDSGEHDRG